MKPLLLFLGTVSAVRGGTGVKNLPANTGDARDVGSIPGSEISPEQDMATCSTPVCLPGKFHGQRILAGYRLWGPKELDIIQRLSTHSHAQYK